MESQKLGAVNEEKDLGIPFTVDLKPPRQCQQAYSSASKVFEMIARVITAELSRALAVVKVTLQVNGNSQFSGVCPPQKKNYWGDKDKIWHKWLRQGREPTCRNW